MLIASKIIITENNNCLFLPSFVRPQLEHNLPWQEAAYVSSSLFQPEQTNKDALRRKLMNYD